MIDRLNSLSSTLMSYLAPDDVAGPPPPDDPDTGEPTSPNLNDVAVTGAPPDAVAAGGAAPERSEPADDAATLVPDWAH